MLGIAVVTYRRPDRLRRLLEQVAALTRTPHELVVADDGSDDGSVDELRAQNVRVVTGENRGVCWNKNRGLFALMAIECDPLILLEDDIYPDREGWEADWIAAAQRWHHIAFAHEKIGEQVLGGTGTPEDPFVNYKATAQCVAVSAEAMRQVGFLDSRFKGYGVGHAEWTTRFKRAGYGFKKATIADGTTVKANLYIEGGLVAEDARSFRDNTQVRANQELFRRIKSDPVYRNPWTTEEERATFLEEQSTAGIHPPAFLLSVPMNTSSDVVPEPDATQPPAPRAPKEPVKRNGRKAKFDTGDVFAMEAMRPLAPAFVPWTSFSLRPSALLTVVNEVDFRRPRLVVECGGGASTLYLARLLIERQMTESRIVTLESDGDWTAYLQGMLDRDGLGEVARVVHAPLVPWEPPEGLAPDAGSGLELPPTWYDPTPALEAIGDDPIGVLLVDGPPGSTVLSRYPAVPALRDRLADEAAVMLDDAHRPAEAEAARRWAIELGRTFTIYERMHLAVGRLGRGFTLLGT